MYYQIKNLNIKVSFIFNKIKICQVIIFVTIYPFNNFRLGHMSGKDISWFFFEVFFSEKHLYKRG
jgi:hypothetical protein